MGRTRNSAKVNIEKVEQKDTEPAEIIQQPTEPEQEIISQEPQPETKPEPAPEETTEVLQDAEHEYRGHLIICEAGGRVVVATHYGIYIAEFDHIDKAKEHIDNA